MFFESNDSVTFNMIFFAYYDWFQHIHDKNFQDYPEW